MIDRRAVLAGLAALATPLVADAREARPRVLAFHYPWHRTPEVSGRWRHWPGSGEPVAATPAGGFYDDTDPAAVARLLDLAEDAGIDGLIASWWGEGADEDRAFDVLYRAAEARGLTVAPYLEAAADEADANARLERLTALGARAAAQRQDGRPVVFVFDRPVQALGVEAWRRLREAFRDRLCLVGPANSPSEIAARREAFDALHLYSLQFEADDRRLLGRWARRFQRAWVEAQRPGLATATVLPGFDDRAQGRGGERPTVPRRGGRTFRALLAGALAAGPDWLLIVSLTEWHEGTAVLPSVEHGAREWEALREVLKHRLPPT